MQIFPKGPEYAYQERWPARIATVMLMVPFCLLAYGLGYAVDEVVPDTEFYGFGGAVATAVFVMLMCSLFLGQWLRGFR